MNGSFAYQPSESRIKRLFKTAWKIGKWPLFSAFLVFVIGFFAIGALAAVNVNQISAIYNEGMAGKAALEGAQQRVLDQNFAEATFDLQRAEEHFANLHAQSERLVAVDRIPIVKEQLYAIDQLSVVGVQISSALETFTKLGEQIAGILRTDGEINIAAMSVDQKREILKKLTEAPPQLIGAKADMALAAEALNNIPETGLVGPLAQAISPLKEQLPEIQSMYDSSLPLIEVLPWIAGYPEERTYLFLLQNNNELRPTGGFIGTYGVLKLKDGEIVEFKTDNIYNLDKLSKDLPGPDSPEPIQTYIGIKKWFMRDANWSPNFPDAAQEVLAAYKREGGPVQEFDGVIAITPTFIESLMELTGPITVRGIEFNSENLTTELQYQVEAAYLENGVEEAKRKEIIGDLSQEIMDRIFALDKSQFPKLWEVFLRNVNEKHILIYVNNAYAQELIEQQNWSGSIKQTEDDYFMIVDANLAALKTDRVMDRTVDYTVNLEEDGLIGRLKITYKNNGTLDMFTTRYRSFTRIYLPPGTEIRSAKGFMTNDFYLGGKPTDPVVSEDFYKTVVSGFIPVELQSERTIELEYKLPDKIKDRMLEKGSYSLLSQKQPGIRDMGLNFTFDVGKPVTWRTPYLDISRLEGFNKVIFNTNLRQDRQFYIEFE